MATAYYNEFDPYAAQWLRNLIKAGLIADGVVDERSIKEVSHDDLKGFTQCHFFAGIGIWSHALRSSGWCDSDPVWTGSCPCQPFSQAGRGGGKEDERHLWPTWYELIKKCKPSVIFGEQVSSKDAMSWLDDVQNNLEDEGYAFASLDICAAGVGAPHIRQRLFWVADNDSVRQQGERWQEQKGIAQHCSTDWMANAEVQRYNGGCLADKERIWSSTETDSFIFEGQPNPRPTNGFWRDADWLYCTDGKWRPVRPGSFPLVNGDPNRMGRLRAYGNAINAEVAKEFIASYMEIRK